MTYLAFVLRRAIIIASSAAVGATVLCVVVVAALHAGPIKADFNTLYFLGARPDENIFELFVPYHLHLRHGGQAVHVKST